MSKSKLLKLMLLYANNSRNGFVTFNSIKILPAMAFENLNSLETLNIQNNKLNRIPEEVMEPVIDTLRVVDIMGKCHLITNLKCFHLLDENTERSAVVFIIYLLMLPSMRMTGNDVVNKLNLSHYYNRNRK